MIPYIDIPKIELFGPFAIQPFGFLVVTGILLGMRFGIKRAAEHGVPENEISTPIWTCVLVGLLFSHAFDVIFYFPERIREDGILTLFKFWEGLSSYGGFLGALIVLMVFYWKRFDKLAEISDFVIQGLVVGWIFGRMGCAIVHDHPGRVTDHWMGVVFPGNIVRWDLGLMEFLYTLLILFPLILLVHRKWRLPVGGYVVLISAAYAPIRFILDFMRSTDLTFSDKRYLGLTPGHWSSMILIAYAAWYGYRIWKNPRYLPLVDKKDKRPKLIEER
jgi:phosphatidylglycerol:prolipoprotein diacylglycerol transferase